jgi:hypothetical protein
VSTSLARVAAQLLNADRVREVGSPAFEPTVVTQQGAAGEVTTARPALFADDWREPAHPWGSDPAAWAD